LVIPVKYQPIFKQKLHEILDKLPFRSLPLLREKVLNVLKEIMQTDDIPEKTCSKHWWFNYMKRNLETKEKWEKILLERTTVKNSKNGSKKHQDQEESSTEADEEEKSVSQQPQDHVFYEPSSSPSLFLGDQEENTLQNLDEVGRLNYSVLGFPEEIQNFYLSPQRTFQSYPIAHCPSPSSFFNNNNPDDSFKFEGYPDDEIFFSEF